MAVGTDQHTDGAELVLGVGLRSPPKGGEVVLSRSDGSQHGGDDGGIVRSWCCLWNRPRRFCLAIRRLAVLVLPPLSLSLTLAGDIKFLPIIGAIDGSAPAGNCLCSGFVFGR